MTTKDFLKSEMDKYLDKDKFLVVNPINDPLENNFSKVVLDDFKNNGLNLKEFPEIMVDNIHDTGLAGIYENNFIKSIKSDADNESEVNSLECDEILTILKELGYKGVVPNYQAFWDIAVEIL